MPAVRRIVILADPNHLGQNLGRLLAADVFGFALGPAISALLVGPFGIPAPFVVVAAATLILLPFVARVRGRRERPDSRSVASPSTCCGSAVRGRGRDGCGRVRHDRHVRLAVGLVHKDLGTSRVDRQPRHHAVRAAADRPRPDRRTAGTGVRAVQGGHRRAARRGALFMFLYGVMPTGGLIFAVAMIHSVFDGLTVSSTGVAVGMTVPEDRQAGAQGVLGAAQAMAAGIMAVVTGALYDQFGPHGRLRGRAAP